MRRTGSSCVQGPVIVLEDDPFWMNEIKLMLEARDETVLQSTSVETALKLQAEHPNAMFIVDIILPERDGIDFIKTARNANPHVKILAISGGGRVGSEFYLKLADAFGAVCTLQKPFDDTQLSKALARLRASGAQA